MGNSSTYTRSYIKRFLINIFICFSKKFNFLLMRFESSKCYQIKVLGPVWYVCLKTENCCWKIFMEIRVGEKVH